ncbi:MAG: GNAT family N-acetyltransferase [Planctomycetes bacterium]|nr:GNAT family N-acetyltransferase [Planctomycetota bacterium]
MSFKQSGIIHKFRRNVQDYGWSTAIAKASVYILNPFYEHRVYRLYRIKTQQRPSIPPATKSDIRFALLHENDADAIEQIEYQAEWLRGEVQARIKAGDFCVVALHKDTVAAFNLIAFGKVFIPLLNTERTLRCGIAWSDHINVHKDYRKQGLGSELRRRVLDELDKRGVKKLYGGTLSSNIGSLKLARRVGFQEFADVEYTKIITNKRWKIKRLRRQTHSVT